MYLNVYSESQLIFDSRPQAEVLGLGGKMKSYRKELWFNIPGRRAFVNITPQVEA